MAQNHIRRAEAQNRNNGNGINATGEKRPPGRPRSEESRQSILRSTLKLLKQHGGFPELSIEAIADDANVARQLSIVGGRPRPPWLRTLSLQVPTRNFASRTPAL